MIYLIGCPVGKFTEKTPDEYYIRPELGMTAWPFKACRTYTQKTNLFPEIIGVCIFGHWFKLSKHVDRKVFDDLLFSSGAYDTCGG